MEFEKYDRKWRLAGTTPRIGIQKVGNFSFNAATYELLRKPRPDDEELWVEFLFEHAMNIIGFRAVDSLMVHNSYPVRRPRGSKSYMLTGKGFLRHHGVSVGKLRYYDALDCGDDVVGFLLKDGDLEDAESVTPLDG